MAVRLFAYSGQRNATYNVVETQRLHLLLRASARHRSGKRPRCFPLQLVHGASGAMAMHRRARKQQECCCPGTVGSFSRRVYFTFPWFPCRLLSFEYLPWTLLPFRLLLRGFSLLYALADLATISLSLLFGLR